MTIRNKPMVIKATVALAMAMTSPPFCMSNCEVELNAMTSTKTLPRNRANITLRNKIPKNNKLDGWAAGEG